MRKISSMYLLAYHLGLFWSWNNTSYKMTLEKVYTDKQRALMGTNH